jgi:hypothetical protein
MLTVVLIEVCASSAMRKLTYSYWFMVKLSLTKIAEVNICSHFSSST